MKLSSTFFKIVSIAIMLTLVSCKKKEIIEPEQVLENGAISISLIGIKSDGGYAYKLGYQLPKSGDLQTDPTCSKLILFENGIELPTPHANHQNIRDYGQGQYSHWGDELYFSASDNSNPLLNGKKYSYIIK